MSSNGLGGSGFELLIRRMDITRKPRLAGSLDALCARRICGKHVDERKKEN